MAHVDYPAWAEHVRALLDEHAPEAREVVEIGCGTGSLALELAADGDLSVRGVDGSAEMIAEAERKAARRGADVDFAVGDFLAPVPGPPADAVVLIYDGLNYLLREADVARLFERAHAALRPGGVFVFDQSTPANSLNHAGGFDDEGDADAFRYVRFGHYDPGTRLHTTTFRLTLPDEQEVEERHVQRAYTPAEIGALLAASPLATVASYGGFSTEPATDASERVHWVARRPLA